MLIENIVQAGQIKSAIIGIGLNINQQHFPHGAGGATSIKQILQKDYDLRALLSEICSHIEAYYLNLKAGKITFIREAYLNRLYWFNENRSFKANDAIFNGIIKNVKDNGLLVVLKDDEEVTYDLKEIEFLNKQSL